MDKMIKDKTKVYILGQAYTIVYNTKNEDPTLDEADGYCDTYAHKIVLDTTILIRKELTNNVDNFVSRVVRHEIIHAFLFESGLALDTSKVDNWASNEEMIDWLAFQFPKINKVFISLGIQE
jgi:hypothetical protein